MPSGSINNRRQKESKFLGRRRGNKLFMSKRKKEIVYTFEEEMWLTYLYKIESDRNILENLLFDPEEALPMYIRSMLCEYFSFLHNMEEIIHKMADEENYDKGTSCFIVSETLALQFTMYMKALVISKENIANNNYSISLH